MKNLTIANLTIIALGLVVAIALVIAIVEIANGNFHSTVAL